MLIHTEQRNGFTINLYSLPPYKSLEDSYGPAGAQEIQSKINAGELVHFFAKVSAYLEDLEIANDYIGSCVYTSEIEFVKSSKQYEEMVSNVLADIEERCYQRK